MCPVLLVSVPDLDLAPTHPEVLDNRIEQGGLANPLPPERHQQQPAASVSWKVTVRHVSSPL